MDDVCVLSSKDIGVGDLSDVDEDVHCEDTGVRWRVVGGLV